MNREYPLLEGCRRQPRNEDVRRTRPHHKLYEGIPASVLIPPTKWRSEARAEKLSLWSPLP